MKNLFELLIFANLFLWPSLVGAETPAEKFCRQNAQKPEITIELSYGKLRYDFSKNNKTLTRMHIRNFGGVVAPGKQVHGLASYNLVTEINFNLEKISSSDKVTCFYPRQVTLRIGVQDPTIYISRNLVKDSCPYIVALRHEQTHQQINAEILEAYLPKIEQTFLNVVDKNALYIFEKNMDINKVQEDVKARYLRDVNSVMDEVKAAIKKEQSKLDSVENYNYEESLCVGR